MEIWKITKYEGYEVSNTGKVRSVGKRKHNKILKTTLNHKGYEVVYPSDKNTTGYKESRLVHRLVAQTFIPNPDDKPQVNHKDGNKQNNNVENLEWVTNLENHIHKLEYNLYPKSHTPKEVIQLDKDGNVLNTFSSLYQAAQFVKPDVEPKQVSKIAWHISECAKGKRKSAYKFQWRFV